MIREAVSQHQGGSSLKKQRRIFGSRPGYGIRYAVCGKCIASTAGRVIERGKKFVRVWVKGLLLKMNGERAEGRIPRRVWVCIVDEAKGSCEACRGS